MASNSLRACSHASSTLILKTTLCGGGGRIWPHFQIKTGFIWCFSSWPSRWIFGVEAGLESMFLSVHLWIFPGRSHYFLNLIISWFFDFMMDKVKIPNTANQRDITWQCKANTNRNIVRDLPLIHKSQVYAQMFPLAHPALFLLIGLKAAVSKLSSPLLPGEGNRKFF